MDIIIDNMNTLTQYKTISSSEAKSRFGTILEWAGKDNDVVVIHLYGQPKGVLISYKNFKEIEILRMKEKKMNALQALKELREEVRSRTDELDEEMAYKQAGISSEVTKKLIRQDS